MWWPSGAAGAARRGWRPAGCQDRCAAAELRQRAGAWLPAERVDESLRNQLPSTNLLSHGASTAGHPRNLPSPPQTCVLQRKVGSSTLQKALPPRLKTAGSRPGATLRIRLVVVVVQRRWVGRASVK